MVGAAWILTLALLLLSACDLLGPPNGTWLLEAKGALSDTDWQRVEQAIRARLKGIASVGPIAVQRIDRRTLQVRMPRPPDPAEISSLLSQSARFELLVAAAGVDAGTRGSTLLTNQDVLEATLIKRKGAAVSWGLAMKLTPAALEHLNAAVARSSGLDASVVMDGVLITTLRIAAPSASPSVVIEGPWQGEATRAQAGRLALLLGGPSYPLPLQARYVASE